jgi:hypothetical protein
MVTRRAHNFLGLLVQQPSTNFAFLAGHSESLARLGALAEWSVSSRSADDLGQTAALR